MRSISRPAIPAALKKAEHYRLLNDAEQAESICLDILAVDPDNQQALVVLILAMTDQFGRSGGPSVQVALEYLKRLDDGYRRHYYEGLIWERDARSTLDRPMGSTFAYDIFRSAMSCYEQASAMSPADDDEAVLRWNACVRTIERAHLSPRPAEVEQPLE
ncbi:MAG: hypothetical protein GEU74_13465 [Nitriliruptorales bacterium]|nr:hypothetical protein [Nitriliruptorales bacterium]